MDYTKVNKDVYLQLASVNGQGKYTLTNVTRVYEKYNPLNNVRGDLNGDKVVDVTDVNIMIDMVLGKQAVTTAADLTGDGNVDVADVNALIDIVLGKS